MKFTVAFTTLALLLPVLAVEASVVVPRQGKFGGQNRFGGFGGKGGFGKGGKGGNKGGQQGGKGGNNAGAGAGAAAGAGAGAAAGAAGAAGAANSTAAAGAGAAAAANSTAGAASANSKDPQSSTILNPGVISTGFEQNGQAVQEAGQVASLTSNNNFINFCLTRPDLPLTNGKQVTTGSCNTAPMGLIPAQANQPSSKFVFPKNGDVVKPNTAFTVQMAVQGFETGNFVNAQSNYFAAPQQLNAQGQIIGHTHCVIEKLSDVQQTTPTTPTTFAFFKGINTAAVNGQVSAPVASGLPEGVYRIASINTAANHQPVVGPVAQHGSFDDMTYFFVSNDANAGAAAFSGAGNATASAAGAAANSTAAAGAGAAAAGAAGAAAGAAGAAAGKAGAGAAAGKGAAAGAAGAGAGAAKGAAGAGAAAGAAKGGAAGAAGAGAAGAGAAAGKGAAAGAGAGAAAGANNGAKGGAAAAGAAKGAQGGKAQGKGGRRSLVSREY